MLQRIPIPKENWEEPLVVGDRVELHFRSTGMTWIKALQIYMIEERLKKQEEFFLRSISTPEDQPTKLIIEVEVRKTNPIFVTVLLISGIVIGAAALVTGLFQITIEKAYKLVELQKEVMQTPAGQIAVGGLGLALPLGVGALLLWLFKKK
ncbi:MAG: hypothetical protein AMJ79_11860 [Phycisphaerae bacterium SM23_30]|nr:MAG: hypothetical protein AMJ79_11860 [Phycisphaerae bacterium SM23_30]